MFENMEFRALMKNSKIPTFVHANIILVLKKNLHTYLEP